MVFQCEDMTNKPKKMLITSVRSLQIVHVYCIITLYSINMYNYVLIKNCKNATKEIDVGLILKPVFSVTTLDLLSVRGRMTENTHV